MSRIFVAEVLRITGAGRGVLKRVRFIDLFAGLGGFNLALSGLGHECVFASEIDKTLRLLYTSNFGIEPAGDIRGVHPNEIPEHDILCAGFPCQPFSKARDHAGETSSHLSDLYLQIMKVIEGHHPRYVIMENVPDLAKHNQGQTWESIEGALRASGYTVAVKKLSPHEFGIPQIRERIYIVGALGSLAEFAWPQDGGQHEVSIDRILDTRPSGARTLPDRVVRCLEVWQAFLDRVPPDEKIPHPLWSMEFGATYPYENQTPWSARHSGLETYRGSYGIPLSSATDLEGALALLPSHARSRQDRFPPWKQTYIRRNREFYERHKTWLDDWIPKISKFPSSFQKLEWNCQEKDPRCEQRLIFEYVVQIRPSGVRVKRRTTAPSLVALTATQVPIVAWERRYMTVEECRRLQSMDCIVLPEAPTRAYAALGNAINVKVAQAVAEALVGRAQPESGKASSVSHALA